MKKLENKITLCLSDDMLDKVKYLTKKHYFRGIQDYIRMALLINVQVDLEKENEE